MTKEEIKKGLEQCVKSYDDMNCEDCPYVTRMPCRDIFCQDVLCKDALSLIIEQEKRIERLRTDKQELKTIVEQVGDNYNKAFERLKAQQQEIDALKAENKQLKTECALLDDELRIARQDTIDVLNKIKDYVNQLACDEYGDSACDTNYITIDIDKYEQDIDEMIEELTKCRR